MYHLNVPAIFVFLIFTIVSGSIAYYCWAVIQRHYRKSLLPAKSGLDYARLRFTVIVMVIPLIGFGFEFIYFLFKTFQELWSLMAK